MTSDLNKAVRMASVPGKEIPAIKRTFLNADYPFMFINSMINPSVPSAPFLYPLKTSENRKVF